MIVQTPPVAVIASRWTPARIAPAGWWTAGPAWCFRDAGKTQPCGVGDPCRVWADRSGNGRDLVNAVEGDRPTLQLTGSRYYLDFDGGDVLACGSSVAFAAADPLCHGLRVRPSGDNQTLCGAGGGPGAGQGRSLIVFGERWYFFGVGSGDWNSNVAMVTDADTVHVCRVSGSGSSIKWAVDGTEYTGSGTLVDTDATAPPVAGRDHINFPFYLTGRVYEWVLVAASVSDADRDELADYLGA